MSSTYGPGRQSREAQLPFLVRGQCRRAANQRRGADTDDRTRKDAALCVLDGSNQGSRQPLRVSQVRLQHTRGGEKEHNRSAHGKTPLECVRKLLQLSRSQPLTSLI